MPGLSVFINNVVFDIFVQFYIITTVYCALKFVTYQIKKWAGFIFPKKSQVDNIARTRLPEGEFGRTFVLGTVLYKNLPLPLYL